MSYIRWIPVQSANDRQIPDFSLGQALFPGSPEPEPPADGDPLAHHQAAAEPEPGGPGEAV